MASRIGNASRVIGDAAAGRRRGDAGMRARGFDGTRIGDRSVQSNRCEHPDRARGLRNDTHEVSLFLVSGPTPVDAGVFAARTSARMIATAGPSARFGPRPGCGPTRPEGRGRACSPRAARRDSFGLAQRVVNLHQGAAPRRVRVRGAENFFEVGRSVPVLFMLTRSRLVRRIALKRQEKRRIGPHS